MPSKSTIIGQSAIRKDARDKVTGEAAYTADISLPNMRYGAILRSPHHHARVKAIDTSTIPQNSGVITVLTTEDIPGNQLFGALIQDQPVLAKDVVRFVGEPVALVIAETKQAACEALIEILVDYEILEPVFDPQEALSPQAPKVHPSGNLATRYEVCEGDVELAFSQADLVIEETFSVPRISPGYLETENSLARWNDDESITVWVSSQKPFEDRHEIASVLGMPEEKVQVKSAVIGGAFGGKEDSSLAVITALGAWAIKGNLQLVNSRWESFLAHPKRHPAKLNYKLAAAKDGRLLGLKAIVHLDTGAYASYGPAVGSLLTEVIPGPYRISNVYAETLVCYTNSPIGGAMRGFGSPQPHFAMESMMDRLAEKLDLDPIEIRKINVLKPGDQLFTRVVVDETANALAVCLQKAEETISRLKAIPPADGCQSGVGLALAVQSMGLGAKVPDTSSNRLTWQPDGKVLIDLGAPDLGQGLATVAEQMVAEALGLPYSQVLSNPIDTATSPNGGVSCASRMTYLVGNGLLMASEQLITSLLIQAAELLRVPVDQLKYQHGQVVTENGETYPVAEFASRAADEGVMIKAESTATFEYPEDITPQHLPIGMPHIRFTFGAQVVRVEVDPELGTVNVTDVVAIHDVGKVINRRSVEGQIEGGVSMGLGYALSEDVTLKPDQNWVDSFSQYLMPTTKDMPNNLEVVLLEIPEKTGPFGAKGIGEIVLVPTAPAIANAVYDAVGVRFNKIPIMPSELGCNRY
jgi:CO/xanthine dehydrogenase Mo-binding subunit